MYKNATKCNETIGKWCKNKHGASKIIDTFETYQVHRHLPLSYLALSAVPETLALVEDSVIDGGHLKPRCVSPGLRLDEWSTLTKGIEEGRPQPPYFGRSLSPVFVGILDDAPISDHHRPCRAVQ
jgi:hypothetical protein